MKVAILITGELRLPDIDNLKMATKNFDIFISTYEHQKKDALDLTSEENIITIGKNLIYLPSKTIYQWYHLNEILNIFKSKLDNYDIILKIRSDCHFYEPINDEHFKNISNKFFYMNSDHSFYAKRKKFYKVLKNFYVDIFEKYMNKSDKYFDINYKNLYYSYKETYSSKFVNKYKNIELPFKLNKKINFYVGMKELVYPSLIYSYRNHNIFKKLKEYDNMEILNNKEFQPIYKNYSNPRNKIFPSEKFFFLHVINKSKVLPYQLPSIGTYPKHMSLSK